MRIFSAALLLAAIATSAPAFAADTGFYAGLDAGIARAGNPDPAATSTSNSKAVAGILGGYQFSKNWGIEGKYTGAGEVDTVNAAGGVANVKADALSLSGVGTLPLSDSFSLYGKLGYASTKTSVSSSSGAGGATRSAPTYGLGILYNVNAQIGVRLGWDRYGAAEINGAGAKQDYNSNVYAVGVVYKFGS
jgi:OmpA-OmpF porin, OOP family